MRLLLGLGRIMARALAVNGASKIFVLGRREDALQQTAAQAQDGNAAQAGEGHHAAADAAAAQAGTATGRRAAAVAHCDRSATDAACPTCSRSACSRTSARLLRAACRGDRRDPVLAAAAKLSVPVTPHGRDRQDRGAPDNG